ncbi:MAG: DegV family protein [Candidatus Fimivivens sp.]
MRKTLMLCDSCCDLSLEQEIKYGIRIVNCSVEMNGMPYEDRVAINSATIYDEVEKTNILPHTSQVTVIQFMEAFLLATKENYTDIICVTMNAKGSGTYSAAKHAVALLPSEYPALEGKLHIRVIDSTTYSYVISMPILLGLERLERGDDPDDVADEMQDWYKNSITLVGLYNLQYAKRSGRLNACAAFVGDILGLKPIMSISGENKVLEKTRGDKTLIPKMAQLYENMAQDIDGDYIIAYGNNPEQAKELAAAIKKLGGKDPYLMGPIGTCVAINAGPKMLGLGFKTKQ